MKTQHEIGNYELTTAELKVVRAAIKGSLDLRERYVRLMPEDKKMHRRQASLRREIPLLKSALAILKG
jgi:hypothetical protein